MAIYYSKSSSSFKGEIYAYQGFSDTDYPGGPGTVYIVDTDTNYTKVILNDGILQQSVRSTVLLAPPNTSVLDLDLIELPTYASLNVQSDPSKNVSRYYIYICICNIFL